MRLPEAFIHCINVGTKKSETTSLAILQRCLTCSFAVFTQSLSARSGKDVVYVERLRFDENSCRLNWAGSPEFHGFNMRQIRPLIGL